MSYSHCHKVLGLLLLDLSWHGLSLKKVDKFNKNKFTFFPRIKIIDIIDIITNPNQISVDIKYTVICYVETWYEKSPYYTITLIPTDTDGWHCIGEYINPHFSAVPNTLIRSRNSWTFPKKRLEYFNCVWYCHRVTIRQI